MISRISGKIICRSEGTVILCTGGISYEILVPVAVMKVLDNEGKLDGEIELFTYHYYQMDQSRAVPVLIGFNNEIEREFFEKFISVSGVGPKAACRALAEPFSLIAGAIDSGDDNFLKKLPGIGQQRARLIVAKLQGNVGKFGLIKDTDIVAHKDNDDIIRDSMEVLMQLQYKRSEAEEMIRKALGRGDEIKTSEDLLNEVYRERKANK